MEMDVEGRIGRRCRIWSVEGEVGRRTKMLRIYE